MHGIYGYPKTDAVRNKIYRLLRKMRRSKMIGFDAITDDSETAQSTKNYESPEDFFGQEERRAEAYALNLQENQPCVLEVFTEGAGKVAQLYQLTRNYHIPTRSPGGYDSIAPKRNLALRAAWEWERTGKRTHVLHCGDFDPDGEEIFRVLVEDEYAFLEAHVPTGTDLAEVLTFDRILTHYEQVIELPEERRATFDPYTVKAKDHRGQRWPHNFTAQLESVGLEVIVPTVRREIEELRDLGQLRTDRQKSEQQRKDILEKVGVLAEGGEVAGEEDGVVPEFVINKLELTVRANVSETLTNLPVDIHPLQRLELEQEMTKRLARRLRQRA